MATTEREDLSFAGHAPWLVLPFRSLSEGKQRLAGLLSDQERYELNLGMLRQSLRLAHSFPGLERTIVVTRCTEAREWAQRGGAQTVLQQGHGLDDAVLLGLAAAAAQGAEDVLVVSCDLPLAQSTHLRRLCRTGRAAGAMVLASDRAGQGTNALYLPRVTGFEPAYGAGSSTRHARAAALAGHSFQLLDADGLEFDIDTPEDYQAWRAMSTTIGA